MEPRGTSQPPSRGLRLLSCDGGGVRGLSSLLILDRLMRSIDEENPPKPCEVFDMIGGNSTGGLIAIMLGRLEMTVQECIDKYLKISRMAFQPRRNVSDIIRRAHDGWNLQGRFDTKALQSEIGKLIMERSNESGQESPLRKDGLRTRSFVVSIDRDAPDTAVLFRTYPSLRDSGLNPRIWEAARATSAASSFFDPIKIGKFGQEFTDGATGFNNPVNQLYDEALDIWMNAKDNIQCVVSIGTGEPGLKPFGNNLKRVGETLVAIATETEDTAKRFAKSHENLTYYRLNVVKGLEDVGLEEYKEIKKIKAVTDRYLQDGDGFSMVTRFGQLVSQGGRNLTFSDRDGVTRDVSPTTGPLQPALREYLWLFANDLKFTEDVSQQCISVVEHVFELSETHHIQLNENPRSTSQRVARTSWIPLHNTYCTMAPSRSCQTRVNAREANWTSDFGGLVLAHVETSEVWRLLSSRVSVMDGDRSPGEYNDWIVNDVTVWVDGKHCDQPLVRADFRLPDGHSLDHTYVTSSAFARAMCGGLGVVPDSILQDRLSNQLPGYERVRMPELSALVRIAPAHRVYFASHFRAMATLLANLVEVAHDLWDHEDSIECDAECVPVKVHVEELRSNVRFPRRAGVNRSMFWRFDGIGSLFVLQDAAIAYVKQLPGDQRFETEDIAVILRELGRGALEPDAVHTQAEACRARFGDQSARWLVLIFQVSIMFNLQKYGVLPESFEALLNSPTRKCYLA